MSSEATPESDNMPSLLRFEFFFHTGGERTEYNTTTPAVGITYRATEFERVYVMTATRIRGKCELIRRDIPRDQIVLKSQPLTFPPSEEPPMTVKDFVVEKLTTFNITADGTRIRMSFISGDGDQAFRLSVPLNSQ